MGLFCALTILICLFIGVNSETTISEATIQTEATTATEVDRGLGEWDYVAVAVYFASVIGVAMFVSFLNLTSRS